jgi:hypothetical protein
VDGRDPAAGTRRPAAPAPEAGPSASRLGELLPIGEWSTEIRQTFDEQVPYLGLLRYVEERWICSTSGPAICRKTATPVTEIFRESGRWVY